MILVDKDIIAAIKAGAIVITPFTPANVGTNSYDVTLAPVLFEILPRNMFWRWVHKYFPVLTFIIRHLAYKEHDCAATEPYKTKRIEIPTSGYVLKPYVCYLGKTCEYTQTNNHVPEIQGKSTLGRLFLQVHFTAGFGDVGFKGHWTLEIKADFATRVYAGQKIGQLVFITASGTPNVPYNEKVTAKYNNVNGSDAMAAKGELK